jgi:hypothetical protein
VAGAVAAPSTASARTNLTRQQIKAMPITERPSRPGHFYGNAVRRNAGRSTEAAWQGMPTSSPTRGW